MIIRDYSVPNIRGIREIRGEATQIARITRIIHGQLMIIRDYSVPNIRGIREIRGEATQIARITRIIHGQLMIIRDYSAPNIPREREKKWKQCLCKPGSVSHTPLLTYEPSAIYLLRKSPCVSSILPSTVSSKGNRTGSPQTMVYMNLQPPDGTAR